MNKLGVVFGVATVAVIAGCKDPNYKNGSALPVQNEVKTVQTDAPAAPVASAAAVQPAPKPSCKCLRGMRHTSPCACGAPDCMCVVEVRPIAPAEPEYTLYIVQNGDYLAKISKRFNVTISSIKRLNKMTKDTVRVGQKLKLPGKIDVGVQSMPVLAPKAATSARKAHSANGTTAYTGATKEYAVQNGDTLGKIAYSNGINIRQLKALNKLTGDSLKIGQKLKIPAEKVTAAAKPAAEKKPAVEKKPEASVAEASAVAEEKKPETAEEAAPAPAAEAPAAAEPAAPQPPATTPYVVQEGDDITGVSIRFGISAAEIRELNNLGENDQLVPGATIKLPAEVQQ